MLAAMAAIGGERFEEGVGEVDEVPFKAGGGRIETMFWAAAAFQLHWETEKLRRS